MKVFGCEMQGGYAGGVILVSANDVKQAYEVASTCDKCDFLFEWLRIDADGEEHFAKPFSEGAVLRSYCYPFEKWHEFEHLSCDYTEPQVILEESHAE